MSGRSASEYDSKPTLIFRVDPEMKQEIEDLSWENRLKKSELLRRMCRYGLENIDEVLAMEEADK